MYLGNYNNSVQVECTEYLPRGGIWIWSSKIEVSYVRELEKEMATYFNILAQRMGSQRVGHDWVANTHMCGNAEGYLIYPIIICTMLELLYNILSPFTFYKYASLDICLTSVHFSCSVAQSCPTLCDPMNRNTPGLSVHHQLPESTQTHVHRVGDAIQPSYPLSSPSPPALNLSQHQGFSNESALCIRWPKYWFQLQHQSFQWTSRTDLL